MLYGRTAILPIISNLAMPISTLLSSSDGSAGRSAHLSTTASSSWTRTLESGTHTARGSRLHACRARRGHDDRRPAARQPDVHAFRAARAAQLRGDAGPAGSRARAPAGLRDRER